MGRKLGPILIGVGAFLVVTALLLRFYAYGQLAVAPADQDSVTTLVGPGANVFDTSTLSNITTDLTTKAKTVGDVKASDEAGNNTVVWVTTSSTKDSKGIIRSRSIERVAFNATSAMAVNCCGEYYETVENQRDSVKHHGLLVKFPFQTKKQTYPWWDSSLLKTVPIRYAGTEKVSGLTTYKFAQTIPPTKTGTLEAPASLLGVSGDGNVTADRYYSNVRTLWAEPETGVVIKRTEKQYNTLRYNGQDRLVTTAVTTGYDDKTVQDNIDKYGPLATSLKLVHTILPIALLLLGILAGVLGFTLSRRSEQARPKQGARAAS